MSKVFRRPMFRKGGGTNMNGIMSGIQDRQNYAVGTQDVEAAEFGFGQMGQGKRSMGEFDFNFALPKISIPEKRELGDIRKGYEKELLEASGDRTGFDPLTTFLLQYGPQVASQTGGGSTLANIVAAAKEPLQSVIKEKRAEDKFLRDIRTQAAGAAIKTKEAEDKEITDIANQLEIQKADLQNKFIEQKNKILTNDKLIAAEKDNLLTELAAKRQLEEEKIEGKLREIQEKAKFPDVSKTEQVRPAFENVVNTLTATYADSKNPAVKAAPNQTAFNITKFRREADPKILAKYKGFKPYTFDNKGNVIALPQDKYAPGDIIYDAVSSEFQVFDNQGQTYKLNPLTFEIQE